jgi:hypothetical protein
MQNMKRCLAALALAAAPLHALADGGPGPNSTFYFAIGSGTQRAVFFSMGAGTKQNVVELNIANLGTLTGGGTARLMGFSLVHNTTPSHGFNTLFRLGVGWISTNFPDGTTAVNLRLGNRTYFGIGEQYQMASWLAFRAEVNRIAYVTTPDGSTTGVRYPATLSAVWLW